MFGASPNCPTGGTQSGRNISSRTVGDVGPARMAFQMDEVEIIGKQRLTNKSEPQQYWTPDM